MVEWASNAGKLRDAFVSFFEFILDEVGSSPDVPRVELSDLKRFARANRYHERTAVAVWTVLLAQINPITGNTLDVTYAGTRNEPSCAQVGIESIKDIGDKIEALSLRSLGPRANQLLLEWIDSL